MNLESVGNAILVPVARSSPRRQTLAMRFDDVWNRALASNASLPLSAREGSVQPGSSDPFSLSAAVGVVPVHLGRGGCDSRSGVDPDVSRLVDVEIDGLGPI